jgi:exosortase A
MHADPGLKIAAPLQRQQAVAAVAAIAGCLLLVFAAFWPTTASMIAIWRRSETFQHCFAVLPITLWLIWRDREALAAAPWRPAWLGLPLAAGFGAMWLLGELGSAQVVAQFALVGMAVAAVLALIGWARFRVIWFPLLFLFFAVPFGEFLVPRLIDWTADFTVAALQLSGIPVYREATNFVIPSGQWSVVEACSGIRYLIASLMTGSLYAWLMYRSTLKRAIFVAASIAVPILANWLRAYGIVMLGHLSDNQIATGVDHLVYGWLFFGVVMLALFWVGARWRDDEPAAPAAWRPAESMPRRAVVTLLLAIVPVIAVWPAAAAVLQARADVRPLQPVPITPSNGWVRAEPPVSAWAPRLEGPKLARVETFVKNGRRVTVTTALYRNQSQGSELVNSQNVIAVPEDPTWRVVARGPLTLPAEAGKAYPAALLRGAGERIAVAHWYWLGTARSTSDAQAKLDLAVDRLLMRGDTSAWVAVQTPAEDGLERGTEVLREFLTDMGPALDAALLETSQR